jgi:hypothetical protein
MRHVSPASVAVGEATTEALPERVREALGEWSRSSCGAVRRPRDDGAGAWTLDERNPGDFRDSDGCRRCHRCARAAHYGEGG